MKKIILTSAFVILAASFLRAEGLSPDTTFQYKQKTIKVEDGDEQIKVKVFDRNESGDIPYKQLYEGIFSDEKSYEKWTVKHSISGIDILSLGKKNKAKERRKADIAILMDMCGIGFANIADKSLNMTEVNGVSIDAGSSHEWFFNFGFGTIPLYGNNFGVATGVGMSWLNLRLEKNTHLTNIDGVTGIYQAPEDIHYSLSRLIITRINIPVLFEWQPFHGRNKMFYSAGIVGGVKTYSSYKIKYEDPVNGKDVSGKERGLNTRPLYLDYMVRAGFNNVGIYAKYSPLGLFQANKGPDIRAVSLGIIFTFD